MDPRPAVAGTTVQGWAALRRATPRQLSQGPAAARRRGTKNPFFFLLLFLLLLLF